MQVAISRNQGISTNERRNIPRPHHSHTTYNIVAHIAINFNYLDSVLNLELSAEVKDLQITATNVNSELGNFATKVADGAVNGIAFAVSFDDQARKELLNADVTPFAQNEMVTLVDLWDWPKQDRAMQGILHYLSHIEQNPDATNRLLAFSAAHDEGHSSLAYLVPNPSPEPSTSA